MALFEQKNPPYHLEQMARDYSIHLRVYNGGMYFRRPKYFTSSAWTFIHLQNRYPYIISVNNTNELHNVYS